jgi:hypothetical protein
MRTLPGFAPRPRALARLLKGVVLHDFVRQEARESHGMLAEFELDVQRFVQELR